MSGSEPLTKSRVFSRQASIRRFARPPACRPRAGRPRARKSRHPLSKPETRPAGLRRASQDRKGILSSEGQRTCSGPSAFPHPARPNAPCPGAFPHLTMGRADFLKQTPSSKDCTTTTGVLRKSSCPPNNLGRGFRLAQPWHQPHIRPHLAAHRKARQIFQGQHKCQRGHRPDPFDLARVLALLIPFLRNAFDLPIVAPYLSCRLRPLSRLAAARAPVPSVVDHGPCDEGLQMALRQSLPAALDCSNSSKVNTTRIANTHRSTMLCRRGMKWFTRMPHDNRPSRRLSANTGQLQDSPRKFRLGRYNGGLTASTGRTKRRLFHELARPCRD